METNIMAILQARQMTMSDSNAIVIVTLILSALAPLLAGLAVYFSSRAAKNNQETEKTVREIHIAVNSERTAMIATIRDLRDEILRLSKDNVTLLAESRGRDVSDALKAASRANTGS